MAEYIIKVGEEGYEKPTVIQELVRCKDCKYSRLQSNETKKYHCLQHNAMMEGHYYCILGEYPRWMRKDGEQT